jgi:hypothetical protein
MDPQLITHHLRAMDPMVLVVTPEPAGVTALYDQMLKKFAPSCLCVGIQQGLLSYQEYSKFVQGGFARLPCYPVDVHTDTLDKVLADDPKDVTRVYILPEVWPSFSQDSFQIRLIRMMDLVQHDPHNHKLHVFMAPHREVIPKSFESMFTIIGTSGGLPLASKLRRSEEEPYRRRRS